MTDTKQCCGNCHWFNDENGDCTYPLPSAVIDSWMMSETGGETCPTFRQRGERLPQRFRYRLVSDGAWSYGACWWNGHMWHIRTQGGWHFSVTDGEDPTPRIMQMFTEPPWLEWIDRDYGWKDSP